MESSTRRIACSASSYRSSASRRSASRTAGARRSARVLKYRSCSRSLTAIHSRVATSCFAFPRSYRCRSWWLPSVRGIRASFRAEAEGRRRGIALIPAERLVPLPGGSRFLICPLFAGARPALRAGSARKTTASRQRVRNEAVTHRASRRFVIARRDARQQTEVVDEMRLVEVPAAVCDRRPRRPRRLMREPEEPPQPTHALISLRLETHCAVEDLDDP